MALQSKAGVFGVDGQTPLYETSPFWQEYSINDIWQGTVGLNKIIPKVGDHVRDPEIYATYKVISLDDITFIPELQRIYPDGATFEFSAVDKLFGVGHLRASDAYRLHVNNMVYPYVACPDTSLRVAGNLCKYARVFKVEQDLSLTVISKIYDSSGEFISDKVPLELVSIHQVTNLSSKIVPPFKLTTELKDGDMVVVYLYADNGNIVSKRELLVEVSPFVHSIDDSTKYVSHISLKSPFLSLSDNTVLNFPINTTSASLNIRGVVHYSNGETRELEVDGSKFCIEGISQLLSSIEGQVRDVVAMYRLDANEATFNGTGADGKTVQAGYKIIVSNENVSYSVKLFPTLVWNGDIYGYSLRWHLLNMDRNLIFDVTNKIEFVESSGSFNPFGYGYMQRKQVSLNLRSVHPSFQNFNHTQVVEIVLFGKPSATSTTPWTIKTEGDVNIPVYGEGLFATKIGSNAINISCGQATREDWINKIYYATAPLIDQRVESIATPPTHFKLEYSGRTFEFSVNEWDQVLNLGLPVTLDSNVTITFIRRTPTADMYLAVAGLSIKNQVL